MSRERWKPASVARRLPVPVEAVACWRCGETQSGRLPGHCLTRNGVTLGVVPLCRTCIGDIPRLDPDPLTVSAA